MQSVLNTAVDETRTLADVGRTLPRDLIGLLFQWLVNHGPFIESDRSPLDDDLFYFETTDVADLGLGEVARRILSNKLASAYSPTIASTSRFAIGPLRIIHGMVEEPIGLVDAPNYIDTRTLANALAAATPEPVSWPELPSVCRERLDRLHIGTHCDQVLAPHPFSPPAGRRIQSLLGVLQRLMQEMDHTGRLSTTGMELRQEYFFGDRARFTSESSTRKSDKSKFSFPDPDGDGKLLCYWHGKVSTPAYRVHFERPPQRPTKRLRVTYIEPHLRNRLFCAHKGLRTEM